MVARRIAVVGTSGSGKTTLSRRIGAAIGLPVIELDAINWQAGWHDLNQNEPEEFKRRVAAATAPESWVSDGNYALVRPLILARATEVVWLDYDRPLVMARVIRRSFSRAIWKTELWPGTGNVEQFRNWLSPDHPIRWAWSTHARRRKQYAEMVQALAAEVTVHHLRHPRDAEALIATLRTEAGQSAADPLAG